MNRTITTTDATTPIVLTMARGRILVRTDPEATTASVVLTGTGPDTEQAIAETRSAERAGRLEIQVPDQPTVIGDHTSGGTVIFGELRVGGSVVRGPITADTIIGGTNYADPDRQHGLPAATDIDCVVTMPPGSGFQARTVSAPVTVRGDLSLAVVDTISGAVDIDGSEYVRVVSVSGDVRAHLTYYDDSPRRGAFIRTASADISVTHDPRLDLHPVNFALATVTGRTEVSVRVTTPAPVDPLTAAMSAHPEAAGAHTTPTEAERQPDHPEPGPTASADSGVAL